MCDWCKFCYAVCRIGCYKCCHKPTPARPEFDVVALGIRNAGKSTLLSIIANEEIGNVQPTKGFSIKALQFPDAILNVKELGGDVEKYWAHYYAGSQGIIFVVDSSDSSHLNEAVHCLSNVLQNATLAGLPLLVLANKQDASGAKDLAMITDILHLNKVAQNHDWIVHGCSSQDKESIQEGFLKLLNKLNSEEEIQDNRL